MSNEAARKETLAEIQRAWAAAQQQLAELRQAVAHHESLAQTGRKRQRVVQAREDALRALGEAVLQAARQGSVQLPATLRPALQAAEQACARAEAQGREITDLLAEGDAAAERLRRKNAPPRK